MYSLERRNCYQIIYGWQQIEGIKEIIMKLRINNNRSNRLINNGTYTKKGIKLSSKILSKIDNGLRTICPGDGSSQHMKVYHLVSAMIQNIGRKLDIKVALPQ